MAYDWRITNVAAHADGKSTAYLELVDGETVFARFSVEYETDEEFKAEVLRKTEKLARQISDRDAKKAEAERLLQELRG